MYIRTSRGFDHMGGSVVTLSVVNAYSATARPLLSTSMRSQPIADLSPSELGDRQAHIRCVFAGVHCREVGQV
jgi:hypothetical protein